MCILRTKNHCKIFSSFTVYTSIAIVQLYNVEQDIVECRVLAKTSTRV